MISYDLAKVRLELKSYGGLVYTQGNMPSYKYRNDKAMSRTVVRRKTQVTCG